MALDPPPMVLVLMGVSGCGKTAMGVRLSKALGWPFRDGDSFHPPRNVEKMRSGVPLDDADRLPWLTAIARWIDERCAAGEAAIVACSALKRDYRRRLIGAHSNVRFVYLKGSLGLIVRRVRRRTHAFMPASLLQSQFAVLEEPLPEERAIVVPIVLSPKRVVARILAELGAERSETRR
jgi:carbohydrate kinase (thermoresistant glucokinase family)